VPGKAAVRGSLLRHISLPRESLRAGILGCVSIAATISMPTSARAWGCEGHQVVALLAEKHLTPHALAMAKQILADGPIDPSLSRYCKPVETDPLADASTWPDDVRSQRPGTSPWHYIDIPLGTKDRNFAKYCDPKEGCVTSAITEELATLRSADADPKERADALRFLIHFVGDLHQPLHAVTDNDEGGNCVPVTFFGDAPQLRNPQFESYAPNLHGVWDTNILGRATTGKTSNEVAAELDVAFRRQIARWQKSPVNIDGWAWESYQLAVKTAYGKLPARVPVEKPQPVKSCADDDHVSTRRLKLDERLGDPYQNASVPVVRERLAQAGARLALLLNQLWQ
jgi:hypothetical protein